MSSSMSSLLRTTASKPQTTLFSSLYSECFSTQNENQQAVPVILHPSMTGQSYTGVAKAPHFIQRRYQRQEYYTHYMRDHPSPNPNIKPHTITQTPQVKFVNSGANNTSNIYDVLKLYHANLNVHKNAPRVNIGGDHSMSIATVAYTLNHYPDAKVIWIDAHPDLNTFESSTSKNIHGMPLAILTGLDTELGASYPCVRNKLSFNNLLYIGIRSIDDFERSIINEHQIQYITSTTVNTNIRETLRIISDFVGNSPIHLSFDVDSIDSREMICCGTPVHSGIKYDSMLPIIKYLSKKNTLVNADITELNVIDGFNEYFDETKKQQALTHVTQIFRTILHGMFIHHRNVCKSATNPREFFHAVSR